MKMKDRKLIKKLDDRGAAIVTVIVVVAFISILATMLLYMAGINYEMKIQDYATKCSFYDTEIFMEEVKSQMALDASVAFDKAINKVQKNFANFPDGTARELAFNQAFYEEFEKIWKDGSTALAGNKYRWSDRITNSILTVHDADNLLAWCPESEHLQFVDNNKVILPMVTITFTNSKGYTSRICADMCVRVPHLDWATQSTTASGSSTKAVTDTALAFEDCVKYMNWTKE